MKKSLVFLMMLAFLQSGEAGAGESLNKMLPKWVNVDLQIRHRYEWRNNFDFNDNLNDKDGFNAWRSRLGISLKPVDDIKLFYQFQDSRLFDDDINGLKANFEDWAETRQLWIEAQTKKIHCEKIGLSAVSLKLGRQEFNYGAQRLVGSVNWSNYGQTFDAGKVGFKFDDIKLGVDIFGGGKTLIKTPREMNDFYDGSANDRLGGYYAVFTGIKDVTFDQYVLNRNTDGKTVSFGQTGDGEIEDYTVGVRAKGKIPETAFDYEVEVAKQFGNSGSLDVDAQMAVAILGYTLPHPWKPRVGFEFNYASGDHNTTDGKRETFDNLYPTNHNFYGFMDFVSLQNINNYRYQLNIFPTKKLELEGDLHLIYLDTPKDNLYAANQTIKRSTVSGADRHVGNEADFLAKYKICDYADISFGYSHLFAGKYLQDTGASNDADFVYVQTTINF